MKKVGFLGACDKTNLIMYVAKALVSMNKRVLVVDTTIEQKTKYIVPSINPTKSYVVEFEKIDFAIGFESFEDIKRYLGIKAESPQQKTEVIQRDNHKKAEDILPYDYALVNIDSDQAIENFEISKAIKNYFVTTFDMYSLRRGMSILSNLKETLKLTKVLYSYDMNKDDEEYLNFISMEYKIAWNEVSLYMPKTEEDNQVIEENQKVYRLRIKKLSGEYQERNNIYSSGYFR